MVVHARAEEADFRVGVGVPRGQRAQVLEDVLLGHPVRQIESPVQANVGGDLLEELLGRLSANLREHGHSVGIGR